MCTDSLFSFFRTKLVCTSDRAASVSLVTARVSEERTLLVCLNEVLAGMLAGRRRGICCGLVVIRRCVFPDYVAHRNL